MNAPTPLEHPVGLPIDWGGHFPLLRLGATGIEFPTYFIVISLALCFCTLWAARRAEARGLSRNRALDIGLILLLFGFLGARLFHVFFEEPHSYWKEPSRALEIWRGGFVWYGGALVGAAAALTYVRWKRISAGAWLDVFAPVCALGYALGRVACLLTGCCYGAICVLPGGSAFRHPTQLYAILWELGALAILLRLERRRTLRKPGRLFVVWLGLHAIGRLVMEAFRADPRGVEIFGLSQATWISLALLVIVAVFLIRDFRKARE